MGPLARYMSGLCVAALGLCAAGWLALAPVAFGYRGSHPHAAALADRATGGALAVVSLVTGVCWVLAWRRTLRADGALPQLSRRQARREARELRRREADGDRGPAASTPDPAEVLSELRALLLPLLPEPPGEPAPFQPTSEEPDYYQAIESDGLQPAPAAASAPAGWPAPAGPPARSGIAAIESMLAGAGLLMVGAHEEEAW